MHRVVEYLEFAADCGTRSQVQVRIDEVLNAAVGTLGDEKLKLQLEIGEAVQSDNVTEVSGFMATGFFNR